METGEHRSGVDRRQIEIAVPLELERRSPAVGRRATDALKMSCPFCGASESSVVRSRGAINQDLVRRRRECAECGERFPTFEAVDQETLQRELAGRERQRRHEREHETVVKLVAGAVLPGSQN